MRGYAAAVVATATVRRSAVSGLAFGLSHMMLLLLLSVLPGVLLRLRRVSVPALLLLLRLRVDAVLVARVAIVLGHEHHLLLEGALALLLLAALAVLRRAALLLVGFLQRA